MKLLSTLLLTLLSFGAMAQSQYLKVAGDWETTISAGEQSYKLVFHIKYESEILSATMDSPDQNLNGIKIDEISFIEGVLKMKSNTLQGSYEGTLKNNRIVEGKWSQGGQSFDSKLIRKIKKRTS